MINFKMVVHTYGKPIEDQVRQYIEKRYSSWMDFSKYHCSKSGMEDEAVDVLNEVILNILEKYNPETLVKMIRLKKIQKLNEYSQFDFFILGILRQNIYSKTAPYRAKNKPIPSDSNVDIRRINIIENEYSEIDKPAQILKEVRLITWVAKGLQFNDFERAVFEHHFINDESFADWPGPENYRKVNSTYHQIIGTIHQVLYFLDLSKVIPRWELSDRQSELADQFVRTHRITRNKQSNQLVNI